MFTQNNSFHCFPIFEKWFVYLLCCNLCKRIRKRLLQLNWSCWSALTSFTHVFLAGASSLSVSLCQYQFTQRGAVLWQRKMNWIIFVLSIVTNSNYLRFIHLYSYFLPDNMWLAVASRLSVLSHFMEAVGVSDYLGCNGLLEFVLGCSGLSRCFSLWSKFVEAEGLIDCLGLQWPLEFLLGCSGLSR